MRQTVGAHCLCTAWARADAGYDAAYMEFILERLHDKNPDGSLSIMCVVSLCNWFVRADVPSDRYTIHGVPLLSNGLSGNPDPVCSVSQARRSSRKRSSRTWTATRARSPSGEYLAPPFA